MDATNGLAWGRPQFGIVRDDMRTHTDPNPRRACVSTVLPLHRGSSGRPPKPRNFSAISGIRTLEAQVSRRFIMSDPNPSFFSRVVGNDSFRKGIAAVIAGALVSVISETLWPSSEA